MNLRIVASTHLRPAADSIPSPEEKSKMIMRLRALIQDAFRLRNEGALGTRIAAKQGMADGYMKALVDAGWLSEKELLQIVAEVRRGVNGPATRRVTPAAESAEAALA